MDLSAPKSSKSGPPQQSLPDVLRNLLRNQSEPLDSSTDTATRGGPEFGPFSPRKAQKADPRNKASQTFCGTFSGTKVNPWTHPQILRPAGVRNLDLSAPKSSKSGPPQIKKTTSPRNTKISRRVERSWVSVCCAECSSLSATAARLAAESPRPKTSQWPSETMACAAAPAYPLEQPSARRRTCEKRIKLEFNSSDTCPVGWKLEKN